MTGIFLDVIPPIIILEPPGKPVPGSRRYRCMACTDLFPITGTSYQTVRDLRHSRRMYVVVCYGCHVDLVPKLPAAGNLKADMNTGRRLLGYR